MEISRLEGLPNVKFPYPNLCNCWFAILAKSFSGRLEGLYAHPSLVLPALFLTADCQPQQKPNGLVPQPAQNSLHQTQRTASCGLFWLAIRCVILMFFPFVVSKSPEQNGCANACIEFFHHWMLIWKLS